MKNALILCILPLPSLAWEFSPDPICTLSADQGDTQIVLTYNPTLPEYAISVTTRVIQWPDGIFFIEFQGAAPLTISTDRQTVTADGATLTVRDTGFGNVLNGLERNQTALAGVGQSVVPFSLDGIGPPMQAFRACPSDLPATS